MTYEESAELMNDRTFRGRCKVALLRYADSILIGRNNPDISNALMRWAQMTFSTSDMVVGQIQGPVVMDAAVQQWGPAINDENLQRAVEVVVGKLLTDALQW